MTTPTRPASVHLPNFVDLLGDSFELHANVHCRAATTASLQWARTSGLVSSNQTDAGNTEMAQAQYGLLASLCFPSCDYPQLVTAIDLMHCMACAPGPAADAAYEE